MNKYYLNIRHNKRNHKYNIRLSKNNEGKIISKTLLIIGNGFDLYCGLSSTFSDFLNYEIKKQKRNINYKSKSNKKYKDSFINMYKGLYTNLYRPNPQKKSENPDKIDFITSFKRSDILHLLLTLCGNYREGNLNKNQYYKSISFKQFINMYPLKNQKTYNYWMLYLELILSMSTFTPKSYNIKNWSDIEKHIDLFMVDYSSNIYNNLVNLVIHYTDTPSRKRPTKNLTGNKNYAKVSDIPGLKKKNFFIVNISTILLILCGILNKKNNEKNSIYTIKPFWSSNNSKNYFYNFLYRQLHNLENTFSNYMNKILNKPSTKIFFWPKIPQLIDKLLPFTNTYFNLLSFNYIKPNKKWINKSRENNNKMISFKNIHSTLQHKTKNNSNDGHPIMGINENDCIDKNGNLQPYIIFSKSFRIMHLSNKLKKRHVLTDNIKNIIFFGHSLNKADYPYFQSIFDRYDIYNNSKITLIFCYAVHDKKHNTMTGSKKDMKSKKYSKTDYFLEKNKCAKKEYQNVSQLINNYELTMDQKSHRKDLWSKLLIEDRLILHCINDKY